jgi:hypothetical protein
MRRFTTNSLLCCALALCGANSGMASEADHREFEATLHAPFQADAAQSEARSFTLAFEYPLLERPRDVSWRLELLDPSGQRVQSWQGALRLVREPVSVDVHWPGRMGDRSLPDGIYTVRMHAAAREALAADAGTGEAVEQSWEIAVGRMAPPPMPAFQALPMAKAVPGNAMAPAPAALPYTVYLGNLHSQTNHSDGGGELASCVGAQDPQSAALGPDQAYAYAMQRGLDILVASEHNHMYDGSDGTNAAADPAAAIALYRSGLTSAADFSAAHPGFLAVYGLEWGVINNGGHLNIFNTSELLGWELNGSAQLLADTLTRKSDYPALYALMRERGWAGQFNHPALSGQFVVNGAAFGYSEDGDQAMALCEVLNSSAFSTNANETETRRSNYELACNKALEAGYHLAFSTDQDNHCANWGASYTNRTGILVPAGTALSHASFIDALRARRVFATMDKGSQLVLTANGRLMGERFTNSGTLTLVANFASTAGKQVASVVMFEGVPGRNGTVSQLSTSANTTITPAPGEHFYYARVTQADGNILWSAPVWVTQSASGDITPPAVTAALSRAAGGAIVVSAAASDNVGVARVEFHVDSVLKASSNVPPYSATVDTAGLSNSRHTVVAIAYDAAGNRQPSAALGFEVRR